MGICLMISILRTRNFILKIMILLRLMTQVETHLLILNDLRALYATKVTTKFILALFFRVKTPKLALEER